MCKALKILCVVSILTTSALAQNEIDHINTLYPSGYGKLAIDGDTLYVNVLNGHGVERYYIADPANPVFIDREEVSGFDQIDFGRRLMARVDSTNFQLIDFSNFSHTAIVSSIPLILPAMKNSNWKLLNNYISVVSSDDTIRTYDISNPANSFLSASFGLYRHIDSPSYFSVFGNTVFISLTLGFSATYMDIYNISSPNNCMLAHSDTMQMGGVASYGISPAVGDTVVLTYWSFMGGQWFIRFLSYAPNDTSHLPSFEDGSWPPEWYFSGINGFLIEDEISAKYYVYSLNNFMLLGRIGSITYNFGCASNDYFIQSEEYGLRVFQPTYSDSLMPEIYSLNQPHFGILSSATYGNYVLSGAESNGGELLIHNLNQSGQLNLVSDVPSVQAKSIIIDGSCALCLCPAKISQVSLSNLSEPVILHELNGFDGELVDFAVQDSLLYAITDRAYYVIDYDSLSGMTILSQMSFSANSLTSIGQYQTTSVLLEGNQAHLVKISAANPTLPIIVQEKQLRPDTFQNVEVMFATIWASGRHGTDILNFGSMDSTAFVGPEYFSDVHQLIASGDTLYVADGINGLRMFTYQNYPYSGLHYIGGYSTGNVVNQLSTVGNNFFISDYYSFQHLRWGAPTGIEGPANPRLPGQFTLMQNYPNPFNAQTIIRYSLPENDKAALVIFDITGRVVRRLAISGISNEIIWDGSNKAGLPVSSGIYFYAIEGHNQSARKMILLR